MRYFSILALIATVLVNSGCDTLNHRQYLLVPVVSNVQFEELRAELGKVLTPVAEKHKLDDSTSDAKASGVVFYYKTKSDFPIQVGAKNTSTGLVVDVIQFHPGTGEGEEYLKIVEDIKKALANLNSVKLLELGSGYQIK